MSSVTPFILQLTEALSAISIPLGGGLAAYAKWRKNAERDRRAREEAARVASERAAAAARKEEQLMRDALISEKDSRIVSLTAQLDAEHAENDRLHTYIVDILRERHSGRGPNGQ